MLRSFEGLSPTAYAYGVPLVAGCDAIGRYSVDGALKVWRVEDGEELAAFQANDPVPGSGARHLRLVR